MIQIVLPFTAISHTAEYISGKEMPFHCNIVDIAKDGNGMMWVGTTRGLRIYNGYEYQRTGTPLDNLVVTCLMTDEGRKVIWVGTTSGLFTIDYRTSKLKKKYYQTKNVQIVCRGRNTQKVYVVYKDGHLLTIEASDSSKLTYIKELANDDKQIHSGKLIVEDGRDLIFISPQGHYSAPFFRYSPEKNTIKAVSPGIMRWPLFLESYGNTLILGSRDKGIQLFDIRTMAEITPDWIKQLNAGRSFFDIVFCNIRGNKLYIYYQNAFIWQIDLKTGEYEKLIDKPISILGDGAANVPMFMDEYQNVWFGQKKGMLQFQNDRHWFQQLLTEFPGMPEKPSTRQIVEDQNGDLYIGTYSGLFHFDKAARKWERFTSFPGMPGPIENQNGILNDTVNDMLYIAGETYSFYRFNKKKKIFEDYFFNCKGNKGYLRSIYGHAIIKDHEGKIWLGTNQGLASFTPATQEFRIEKEPPFDVGEITVTCFAPSADKNVFWAGSDAGLFKIDIHKGIQKRLYTGSQPALNNSSVYAVSEDAQGNLWMGTDNGINIVDKNLTTAKFLNSTNSGICDNTVYSMLWQNDHTLWVGTQRGMSKYDIRTNTFSNYFIEDGICNNEFNRNSTLKGRDGRLYMGGVAGVTTFFPDIIQESLTPSRLFVSSITMWDKKLDKERSILRYYDENAEIRLNDGNMPLTFDLGISDYSDASKNTYYYRIKGLNSHEGWIAQGPMHRLRLTNLPTGSFTLEIKAANSRGIASANILRYQLTVIPPFYQTWWFYSLVVLVIVSAIYLVILLRLKNARLIEQQRVKIASDLHDEIGGLVTRITVYSSSLRENYLTREEQSLRLEKIIDISQSLSTSIRDVLWAIDARNDKTSNLADYMMEHTQNQIRFTNIKLIFETDVDADIKMSVFTRQQLYRIFKEAINNILKHSNATYIKINYVHQQRKFRIAIENDGADCIPSQKSHIGQGSRNMIMRAKSIGAVAEIKATDKTYTVLIYTSGKLKRHK